MRIKRIKPVRDLRILEERLQHWFNVFDLSCKEGIALLLGFEPDAANISRMTELGSGQKLHDRMDIASGRHPAGVSLLDGSEIKLPSFSESDLAKIKIRGKFFPIEWLNETEDRDCPEAYREASKAIRNTMSGYVKKYNDWLLYCDLAVHPKPTPLKLFVDWALSKDFEIDWLDHAIEWGLYTPKQESEEAVPPESVDKLGPRKQQLEIILAVIAALEFEPLQIPNGGKAKIKVICLTRPDVFTDSGFDHAWRVGLSAKLFKLGNHEKYSNK